MAKLLSGTTRDETIKPLFAMGLSKLKTEGGSGGKRGRSNMNHWTTTEEIKVAARKQRRLESKQMARKARLSTDSDL